MTDGNKRIDCCGREYEIVFLAGYVRDGVLIDRNYKIRKSVGFYIPSGTFVIVLSRMYSDGEIDTFKWHHINKNLIYD